jgi:hydrogenase maturation protease
MVIIGIGHPDRGDDAVGRLVAEALAGRTPPGVTVTAHDGEATGLLALLEGKEAAILIDAALMDAPAGTIRRIDALSEDLPERPGFSTHGFGLAAAVALGKALGMLPRRCIVLAVAAERFDHGAPPGRAVAAAVPEAAALALAEAAAILAPAREDSHA